MNSQPSILQYKTDCIVCKQNKSISSFTHEQICNNQSKCIDCLYTAYDNPVSEIEFDKYRICTFKCHNCRKDKPYYNYSKRSLIKNRNYECKECINIKMEFNEPTTIDDTLENSISIEIKDCCPKNDNLELKYSLKIEVEERNNQNQNQNFNDNNNDMIDDEGLRSLKKYVCEKCKEIKPMNHFAYKQIKYSKMQCQSCRNSINNDYISTKIKCFNCNQSKFYYFFSKSQIKKNNKYCNMCVKLHSNDTKSQLDTESTNIDHNSNFTHSEVSTDSCTQISSNVSSKKINYNNVFYGDLYEELLSQNVNKTQNDIYLDSKETYINEMKDIHSKFYCIEYFNYNISYVNIEYKFNEKYINYNKFNNYSYMYENVIYYIDTSIHYNFDYYLKQKLISYNILKKFEYNYYNQFIKKIKNNFINYILNYKLNVPKIIENVYLSKLSFEMKSPFKNYNGIRINKSVISENDLTIDLKYNIKNIKIQTKIDKRTNSIYFRVNYLKYYNTFDIQIELEAIYHYFMLNCNLEYNKFNLNFKINDAEIVLQNLRFKEEYIDDYYYILEQLFIEFNLTQFEESLYINEDEKILIKYNYKNLKIRSPNIIKIIEYLSNLKLD